MAKKGQAAMEFLMTYGWAILVVLIAIGALAYFGVLNPSRFLPASCTLMPGMSCDAFIVNSTGITMKVTNGMGSDLTSVQMTTASDASTCTSTSSNSVATFTDGSSEWFRFSCTPSGSRFKGDISVAYTQEGIAHTRTGQLVTEIE